MSKVKNRRPEERLPKHGATTANIKSLQAMMAEIVGNNSNNENDKMQSDLCEMKATLAEVVASLHNVQPNGELLFLRFVYLFYYFYL